MEVLAALNLGDIAQVFSKMGMFPVFDVAYYIVSILYLKYEPGKCVLNFCLCFFPPSDYSLDYDDYDAYLIKRIFYNLFCLLYW